MSANGAQITGQLDLEHATLANASGTALSLSGARIDGNAFLERLTATGEVSANGAQIAGDLDLEQATLANASGIALARIFHVAAEHDRRRF